MIKRQLEEVIGKNQKDGFINIIYGSRRVGKTVLINSLVSDIPLKNVLILNGDHKEAREILSDTSEANLSKLTKKYKVIVIDEAQRIPNIGLSLKILIDKYPEKTFYVSGSSSLSLAKGIKESLTGRYQKYKLYSLSTVEITKDIPDHKKPALLPEQLIYGGYPYLLQLENNEDKKNYLKSIIDDYLFNDIKDLKEIISEDIIKKLATLLAFQVGSVVSLNELSRSLGIDVKTVDRYISLLKQSFIIFELGSFSTNPRKELIKSKKYYFCDNGIRNALTDQFLSLDSRNDTGQLWENFLAVERVKQNEYKNQGKNHYFWRSYEKAEIDWIETKDNTISAFEFKWNKEKNHTPKSFKEKYKALVKTINKNNYLEFIK